MKKIALITLFLSALFGTGCVDPNYNSGYPDYRDPYDRGYHNDGYYNDDYSHDRYEERRARKELERERDRLESERRRLEDERRRQQHEYSPPPPVPRPLSRPTEHCPSGFSPSENKCSKEERRHGCQDMRLPGGLGCVKR